MKFDIDRYCGSVQRLSLDGIDFDAFRSEPLPAWTLRCLRYMHDIEHHTVCYLRDLLVTPIHQEPDVTAFLTLWAFEELWHGEAIGAVLTAHDEPAGPARVVPLRRRRAAAERWKPLVHSSAAVDRYSSPALVTAAA